MESAPRTPAPRTPALADSRGPLPFLAGDRESLAGWLEFYRQSLPLKLAGLTAEQLCRASVPPSTLTLIGLTRHLSDVERYWWATVATGTPVPPHYEDADPDADFNGHDPATAFADVAHYTAELARLRPLAAAITDLDAPLPGRRHDQPINLRWIYTHLIEEYARHLGHADLLRECLDGTVGY